MDDCLHRISRDNAQLLLNSIFSLPTMPADVGVLAQLPAAKTALPREKPLPKPKEKTKWEKFAQKRGIHKKKKSAMVFDDAQQEFIPRHGAKSAKNDSLNDWVMEIPQNADPYEDQYAKKRSEKKERIRKNEAKHKKNMQGGRGKSSKQKNTTQ